VSGSESLLDYEFFESNQNYLFKLLILCGWISMLLSLKQHWIIQCHRST